jgi:hypothetical protein
VSNTVNLLDVSGHIKVNPLDTVNIEDAEGYFGVKEGLQVLTLSDVTGRFKVSEVKNFWNWSDNIFFDRDHPFLITDEWSDNILIKRDKAHCY